eukprot:4204685-Amphidinium_carterae.2
MGTSLGEVLASQGGISGDQLMPNTNDVLDLQRDPVDNFSPVDVLDPGEDEELVLSTTKELKVMKEEDEIKYWKQMWKECEFGLSLSLEASTTGDSFFDRKMRAIMAAKEDKYRMFDSYLIQRFPLNDQQRHVRGSGHYDPGIQWWSENLIGTLALSPQRELAWATMRTLIRSTPSPLEAEEQRKEEKMSYEDIASKILDFYLQYHGDERDIRGKTVLNPRNPTREQRLLDHLASVIQNKRLSVVELQYRLVSLSNDGLFYEHVVQWWHAMGKIILPRLRDRRVITQTLHTLSHLLTFMYQVMTTVYMKDISHLGGIGQYGDDGGAFEEGSEQIHTSDFGNQCYASVINDRSLPSYTDMTVGFTEEDKGDVLETLMGLNFLEKEHRLSCMDMGITAIEDAQETMLKVEWYTFRKGLEWSLSYFHDHSPITAIIAMREACTNYVSYDICGRARSDSASCDEIKEMSWMRKEKEQCQTSEDDHLLPQTLPELDVPYRIGYLHDRLLSSCGRHEVRQLLQSRRCDEEVVEQREACFCCVLVREWTSTIGKPVILEHFASLLNPRVPWWTNCDFPAECSSELDERWTHFSSLIAGQMAKFPNALETSQQPDSNMPVMYRQLRSGMDERIKMMTTQPNYGRGIPVLPLDILGVKGRSVGRQEVHVYNLAVLRELNNPDLTKKYNDHMIATTKFLTTITDEGEGVGGVLASTPAQEPQIIEQARRKVGVTLNPGPALTSMEFAGVDLVLVDQNASHRWVCELMLSSNVVLNTVRVRGIAVKNPWKAKRKQEPQPVYVPADTVDTVNVYVDYLQAKGIASEGAIRCPTREFYRERFIVPGNRPLSDAMKQDLEEEGVDVTNHALNRVEGLWVLTGYALKEAEGVVRRYRKIVEVGAEGAPRRASLVRKEDPARFQHDKWNGSPECLTISHQEFRDQFWYKDRNGHFGGVNDPELLEETLGDLRLEDQPTLQDCQAQDRVCRPCGGAYGQLFPCMLCE